MTPEFSRYLRKSSFLLSDACESFDREPWKVVEKDDQSRQLTIAEASSLLVRVRGWWECFAMFVASLSGARRDEVCEPVRLADPDWPTPSPAEGTRRRPTTQPLHRSSCLPAAASTFLRLQISAAGTSFSSNVASVLIRTFPFAHSSPPTSTRRSALTVWARCRSAEEDGACPMHQHA